MGKRDYYEVLGVTKETPKDEIKKAYRKMAIQYHPDKNPDNPEAEEKFKEAAEAYEILSNDEKKKQYDMFGHQSPQMGGGGFNPFDLFREHFGDIFGGGRSQRRTIKGQDARINIKMTLEEIFEGKRTKVKYKRMDKCGSCNGDGGTDKNRCKRCGGNGVIMNVRRIGGLVMQQQATCPSCNGDGHTIDNPCKKCDGNGVEMVSETIEVEIPSGIFDGAMILIGGKGHAVKGGINGDLQVIITEKAHDYYERKGSDLKYYLYLTYPELILGCLKEVPIIDGTKAKIEVKELSRPNTILRLRNKGMISHETGQRGDLHIELVIDVPTEISNKERSLLEELKKIKK